MGELMNRSTSNRLLHRRPREEPRGKSGELNKKLGIHVRTQFPGTSIQLTLVLTVPTYTLSRAAQKDQIINCPPRNPRERQGRSGCPKQVPYVPEQEERPCQETSLSLFPFSSNPSCISTPGQPMDESRSASPSSSAACSLSKTLELTCTP